MKGLTQRLADAFGIEAATKTETVSAMLVSGRGRAGGYWLQLVTAMVIATLGLVVGSTAVVIGAMLVSPLMTPIIHLGMGLAIGSPVLVVHSSIRFAVSSVAYAPDGYVLVAGGSQIARYAADGASQRWSVTMPAPAQRITKDAANITCRCSAEEISFEAPM